VSRTISNCNCNFEHCHLLRPSFEYKQNEELFNRVDLLLIFCSLYLISIFSLSFFFMSSLNVFLRYNAWLFFAFHLKWDASRFWLERNLVSVFSDQLFCICIFWAQFHQHSTCSFCASRLTPVKYKPKT